MRDFELLPQAKCRELFAAVQQAARRGGVPDVEVMFGASEESLTRFANNEIHQNVAERTRSMSIRAVWNQRTARATTNRLHRDGIQSAVDEVIALVKQSEADPDLLPLHPGGEPVREVDRYRDAVAGTTPAERARMVKEAIRIVESEGQSAAGIYSTGQAVEAIANSAGLFRYYGETQEAFSITATAPDSSGWAKASDVEFAPSLVLNLAAEACRKAALSANPRTVNPGRYTVILEPAAVLDLVGQIFPDFSGTALADQKSFLSDRLGTKIFGDNITVWDDAGHALQTGAPFDGEGVARKPLLLVENGTAKEVAYSRAAAIKAGVAATGHGFRIPNESGEAPLNIVMTGGEGPVSALTASTREGILVTRLWYIREVEPYDKIMTGMTRDGTFLIRDGEIVCGLKNFRFNQSVVELLRNVESLSGTVRSSGEEAFDMAVPGMKAHDFHFTELTTF